MIVVRPTMWVYRHVQAGGLDISWPMFTVKPHALCKAQLARDRRHNKYIANSSGRVESDFVGRESFPVESYGLQDQEPSTHTPLDAMPRKNHVASNRKRLYPGY